MAGTSRIHRTNVKPRPAQTVHSKRIKIRLLSIQLVLSCVARVMPSSGYFPNSICSELTSHAPRRCRDGFCLVTLLPKAPDIQDQSAL